MRFGRVVCCGFFSQKELNNYFTYIYVLFGQRGSQHCNCVILCRGVYRSHFSVFRDCCFSA